MTRLPNRQMEYECSKAEGRCWLKHHVPRLTVFDECFPGEIGFSDMDGVIERKGKMLVLEFAGRSDPEGADHHA